MGSNPASKGVTEIHPLGNQPVLEARAEPETGLYCTVGWRSILLESGTAGSVAGHFGGGSVCADHSLNLPRLLQYRGAFTVAVRPWLSYTSMGPEVPCSLVVQQRMHYALFAVQRPLSYLLVRFSVQVSVILIVHMPSQVKMCLVRKSDVFDELDGSLVEMC